MKEKKSVYIKPTKVNIATSYWPYSKELSEAEKLDIIGLQFRENGMILCKK